MPPRCFLGFGFGAIQAGLFLAEAYRSERFDRLVVAEVLPEVVEAVRADRGAYAVNVAEREGLRVNRIEGVEVLNPREPSDRRALAEAASQACEMATALPSVDFYNRDATCAASILAEGIRRKIDCPELPRAILYAGENHNHAAEILTEAIAARIDASPEAIGARFAALNTVIGKMSGVVSGRQEIDKQALAPMTGHAERAFLVEAFNRILVSRPPWEDFTRGIQAFEVKSDLLPFEEAKLYGHNATHALIGYLASEKRYAYMSDAGGDEALMALAREAFLEESGAALIHRHRGVDPLFTPEGYREYADDLLERMVNPWLRDAVGRIVRDPRRKLGWDDRLVGTMRVALAEGVEPRRYALGAAAAMRMLEVETGQGREHLAPELWPHSDGAGRRRILDLIEQA